MAESTVKFACEACKRQYTWKPELAGKKAKCKCGHTMVVPNAAPEEDFGTYDVADDAPAGAPGGAASECPNCGQALAAGAVLCVACGYNLKTGRKMGTSLEAEVPLPSGVTAGAPAARATSSASASSGAPGRPAPAILPYGTPKRHAPVEEDSGKGKMITAVVVGLVILGAVGAGAYLMRGGAVNDNFPPAVAGDDARILKAMRDNGTEEAKAFLEGHSSRSLGHKPRHTGQSFVDNFYSLGAKEVRCYSNGLMAREVILILPDDAAARPQLFRYKNRQEEEAGVPPTKDVGQRYLTISAY